MNANEFRQNLKYGGARANKFDVGIAFPSYVPGGVIAGNQIRFRAKATQAPGMTIGTIEVPYQGRTIKIAGDRVFEEWNVTVINDEDYAIRNAFEAWQNGISQIDFDTDGERIAEIEGINDYVADVVVRQRTKKSGSVSKQYLMKNAFPTAIGPIELSWDSQDTIEEFDVTFAFDYFVTNGVDDAGSIGGGIFSILSDLG
tara:strand:- start:1938 stop:2537 length:600 start_codon:yes stop_codon:yes gene_type:complete